MACSVLFGHALDTTSTGTNDGAGSGDASARCHGSWIPGGASVHAAAMLMHSPQTGVDEAPVGGNRVRLGAYIHRLTSGRGPNVPYGVSGQVAGIRAGLERSATRRLLPLPRSRFPSGFRPGRAPRPPPLSRCPPCAEDVVAASFDVDRGVPVRVGAVPAPGALEHRSGAALAVLVPAPGAGDGRVPRVHDDGVGAGAHRPSLHPPVQAPDMGAVELAVEGAGNALCHAPRSVMRRRAPSGRMNVMGGRLSAARDLARLHGQS